MDFNLRVHIISLAAAVLVCLPSDSFADSLAPPSSYVIEAEGGQFVFVMLAPMTLDEELSFWNKEFGAKIRDVRQKYSASGMYLTGDETSPIWTVDWYAHSVLPFSDGIHVVREGPWARSRGDEAVSFFENGKLLKSYSISDLNISRRAMSRTISHFFWREKTSIADAKLTYEIEPRKGKAIVFDVTTGEIVNAMKSQATF
jgi:hypothetical protein